jgi:hypothetical protein
MHASHLHERSEPQGTTTADSAAASDKITTRVDGSHDIHQSVDADDVKTPDRDAQPQHDGGTSVAVCRDEQDACASLTAIESCCTTHCPAWVSFTTQLHALIQSTRWFYASSSIVIFNGFILTLFSFDMNSTFYNVLWYLNHLCSLFFVIEMVMTFVAVGMRTYVTDRCVHFTIEFDVSHLGFDCVAGIVYIGPSFLIVIR